MRQALGPERQAPQVPRDYRQHGSMAPGELVTLMAERLRDYKAAVRTCDESNLEATIADALRDRGVRTLVLPTGLSTLTLPETVTAVVDDGQLTADELDRIDAVITGSTVAIAETGTIILDTAPDQGRRAITLVPDYHLCVVRSTTIVATVPEAIAVLDPTKPLTWISGPSATSDIELNRVEGVHGPRTLEVILVGQDS